MTYLIVLNDPAYGSERSYNGLRLAMSLAKRDGVELRVFLMGDAVTCAVVERMIHGLTAKGVAVGCCGTCLQARGIGDERLVAGAEHSSLAALTDWVLWAERVLVLRRYPPDGKRPAR